MGRAFTDFVNSMNEKAKEKSSEFNPEERIKAFIGWVNSLYANIDEWLSEELMSGAITTKTVRITITEERLGAYEVMEKWIQIGRARITLHPVGTIMIGTKARVDMEYGARKMMLVRVGENVNESRNLISLRIAGEPASPKKPADKVVWKVVKDRKRLSYVTLTKESFENIIMELINGTD